MHETEQGAEKIPAFLAKLWHIVQDTKNQHLITWSPNGRSFIIKDQAKFTKELLPHYFKHANMASFIRQLNMYGFKKITSLEQGLVNADKDETEFQHPYFIKNQLRALEKIKRKHSAPRENAVVKSEDFSQMLLDIQQLRSKQESMDTHLSKVKKENEVLWRELVTLRHKHKKQESIVISLIQFLAGLIQRSQNSGLKRKHVPMLEEMAHQPPPKMSRQFSLSSKNSEAKGTTERSPAEGPVIHDVTDNFLEQELIGQIAANEETALPFTDISLDDAISSPMVEVPPTPFAGAAVTQPEDVNDPNFGQSPFTENAEPNEILGLLLDDPATSSATDTTVSLPGYSGFKNDMENYLDFASAELDSIKNLVTEYDWSNVDVDADALYGLLHQSFSDSLNKSQTEAAAGIIQGNELIQFDDPFFNANVPLTLEGDTFGDVLVNENYEPVSIPEESVNSDILKQVDEFLGESGVQTSSPGLRRQNSRSKMSPQLKRSRSRKKL